MESTPTTPTPSAPNGSAGTSSTMATQQDALRQLRSEGFDHDAWLTDDGTIAVAPAGDAPSSEGGRRFESASVTIVETFRFEGASNPDDEAMLLGVEMADGTKAALDVPYGPDLSGPQADAVRSMFIDRN